MRQYLRGGGKADMPGTRSESPLLISRRRLWVSAAAALGGVALARLAGAEKGRAPADEIFCQPSVLAFKLTLSLAAMDKLRKDPRKWVEADVAVDGQSFARVGLHLKSNTSFLPLDKKPSFTVSFHKYVAGENFKGLRKVHLNNSVQDATYLCEDLAGELFHRAGVPRARGAWATVELNGRPLGLYVFKEGFTSEFLRQHFTRVDGNFYDGGLHQDIFDKLLLDSGDGCQDGADLKALHAASQVAEPGERWLQLQKLLDVDRFVSMMAMEGLTCHVDGYSLMQNNYRIYFNPPPGRAVFVVHGMDRMFEQADFPVEPSMRAVLSRAVLGVPEGLALYRRRLAEQVGKIFQPEWMTARLDAGTRLLKGVEPLMEAPATALRQRLLARVEFARKHVKSLVP
jgi:hypothetical protein